MTFREHTYKRRQEIASRWYVDEMIYGEIGPTNSGNNHAISDHLRQLNASYPKALAKALQLVKDNWGNIVFPAPHDFEDLYSRLEKLLKNNTLAYCCVHGIGVLALYDFALFIGCNLYPKVLPERYVYVHNNKVKHSAEILLNTSITGNRIPTSAFKGIFDYFHAMEIEDILCIYADLIDKHKIFDKTWLNQMP